MEATMISETKSPVERPREGRIGRANPPRRSIQRPQTPHIENVGTAERVVSSLIGGALLLRSLARPTPAGAAFALGGGALLHRGVTGHCYVYQALGRKSIVNRASPERSITIETTPEALYRAWRDPQHVAAMLREFATIEASPDGRWHWRANLPNGQSSEWTTTLIEDKPNELLVWRTEPGAPIQHMGSIRFSPAPRDWGTVATLRMMFGSGDTMPKVMKAMPKIISGSSHDKRGINCCCSKVCTSASSKPAAAR